VSRRAKRNASRASRQGSGARALSASQPRRWREWWPALAIAFAATLVYSGNFGAPFIFDDRGAIELNPAFQWWPDIPRILASMPSETPFSGRPVVTLTFALNYAWGGLDVRGYHAVNLGIHIACALLLFGLVRRTLTNAAVAMPGALSAVGAATVVALLWAVHPLNTEAVAYITQRTEALFALFALLTLYASVRAHTSPRVKLWQRTAIWACVLGMSCKETMVATPVLVALYDRVFVYPSFRSAFAARGRFYGWLAATWIVLAVVVLASPRTFGAGFSSTDPSAWNYLLNQTLIITRYLWLSVWPQSLVLFYGWSHPTSLAAVWPYALFITSLAVLTLAAFRWRPAIAFLGAWVFIVLAPTSSVAPIAGEVGAERRMYLALPALVTIAVVLALWLWNRIAAGWPADIARRRGRAVGVAALTIVTGSLGFGTVARTREYASALTMARTVYERWPSGASAHMLGTELRAAGRREEAVPYLREGAATYPPSRYVLAVQLSEMGKVDEAITEFRRFIHEEPNLDTAREAERLIIQALIRQQRWSEAIAGLKDMIDRSPGRADAIALLADTYFMKGDHAAAIPVYQTFLGLEPGQPEALANLGIAFAATGRTGEAVETFRAALRVKPNDAMAALNLARALLDRGSPCDVAEAEELAKQGVARLPTVPAAYELLGHALELSGNPPGARAAYERALTLDPCYQPARVGLLRVRSR
jgi:tetratricopeptide (TPR) repeat protein